MLHPQGKLRIVNRGVMQGSYVVIREEGELLSKVQFADGHVELIHSYELSLPLDYLGADHTQDEPQIPEVNEMDEAVYNPDAIVTIALVDGNDDAALIWTEATVLGVPVAKYGFIAIHEDEPFPALMK